MPNRLIEFKKPLCKECGTPKSEKTDHAVVLYFKDRAFIDEFVAMIRTILPGLKGYQYGKRKKK